MKIDDDSWYGVFDIKRTGNIKSELIHGNNTTNCGSEFWQSLKVEENGSETQSFLTKFYPLIVAQLSIPKPQKPPNPPELNYLILTEKETRKRVEFIIVW